MATYYSEEHEWIDVNGDTATLGITKHAAEQLGDVVFVEQQEVGDEFEKDGEIGVIESVKAASELYAPVDGEIVEVNEALVDSPETVNQDAYGEGWLFRLQPADVTEMAALMDGDAYDVFLASEAH